MEWSGRAPAPPAIEIAAACHVQPMDSHSRGNFDDRGRKRRGELRADMFNYTIPNEQSIYRLRGSAHSRTTRL